MTLLRAFVRNGFCPTLIKNGRKILVMELKTFRLRFITSNSYFNIDEYALANQFNIKFEKIYFPQRNLEIINCTYSENIPKLQYFLMPLDSEDEIKAKELYVKNLESMGYKWIFEKELIEFCEQKLWLLVNSCLKFIDDCFEFQVELKKLKDFQSEPFLNPFSYPLCSLSGFVYKLFKLFFLNKANIYIVDHEFGICSKNVSKIEHEWASYMEFLKPEDKYQSAFNNSKGQKYFKEAIPDLYSPVTKKAYFFQGCVFHGHFENCTINKQANELTKNPFGKTYKELNEEFFSKMNILFTNNPDEISEVVIIWECWYRNLRSECSILQTFLKTNFMPHPLFRLNPRTCVRGAYFDVFALQWSQKLFPNEKLYFLDVNGLYSFCAIKNKFMTGKYLDLIGTTLKDLFIIDNKFYYKKNKIMGSILLTILPPKDLVYPFLLYRTTNGQTVNTLCRTCAENHLIKCKHNETERAITSCYMLSEIEFALQLNYKIICIHECHVYQEADFILKDFVQFLNYFKTRNSNLFENVHSTTQKELICQKLNKELDLTPPNILTAKNVQFNSQKRSFHKFMANALFGKLEQRNDKSQTVFVNNQSDLEKLFFSNNSIVDLFCLNDEICQVQIRPNIFKLPPNRKSNCYIGAQLTAYARQTIYEHLQSILKFKAVPYQIDCDSIIFAVNKNEKIPLEISEAVGHFKHEIAGEICSYHSLGPKNYCITFEQNGRKETVFKVKGLSLNNASENPFNEELFPFYIEQFLSNKKEKLSVKQYRKKGDFKRLKINSHLEDITFTNSLTSRRIIQQKTKNLNSFPYGYSSLQ